MNTTNIRGETLSFGNTLFYKVIAYLKNNVVKLLEFKDLHVIQN